MGRIAGAVTLGLTFGITGLLASLANAEVTIDRKPAVVEHKTFDPAHRPAEMPPLKTSEAAVTQSQFDCSMEIDYKVVDRKTDDAHCTTSLRVQSVRVTLSLKVIVWLPAGAPPKLIAHEEGHRKIDNRIYEDAPDAARSIAGLLDGRVLTGSGGDCVTAEQHAVQAAVDESCRDYLRQIGKRAGRVSDEYDAITAHGTKSEPLEEEAVRQAFACEEKDRGGLNGRSAPKR